MSKTKLRAATYSIHCLVKQMGIQSFTSRADMQTMLIRCIKDLHELGYKVGHIKGIKEKHIKPLIEHWQAQQKSNATIKNYLSKLRKMSSHLGAPHIIKKDNVSYGIGSRAYLPKHNKAIYETNFSHCKDPYIQLSLEGQALFGFRREESIKFILSKAYEGNYLKIEPSWTKGGIGRMIPIRNDAQRQWLYRVGKLVRPGQALIPRNKSYKTQLSTYQYHTSSLGLSHCHGLRHAYAQRRYQELTTDKDHPDGLLAPIAGGPPCNSLSDAEKTLDHRARTKIAFELGHARISITKTYLG